MLLSKVILRGFRNFKNAEINLSEKALVIGPNDIGKTNLIWAIRLLLDRSLTDIDREPRDGDFYALEETNEFQIRLEFTDITEECVRAKMKEKISGEGGMFIVYKAIRDPATRAKTHSIFVGPDMDSLEGIEDRYYLRVLNVNYIGSRRDFYRFIDFEKARLLQDTKEARDDDQIEADQKLEVEIAESITIVDEKIPQLTYVADATKSINEELSKLSIKNDNHSIVFDAISSDINTFIESVSLSAKSEGRSLTIGGDGRLNQIYLCLWAGRHTKTIEELEQVSIVCIEEPEAHLHPHQQRKLADYLNRSLSGQVLMTSHSPQITAEFSPNAIVRLLQKREGTVAASQGCSEIIDAAFQDFGYRMSIIPAEAFFADLVLLVEGPSEEQFYKTLAKQIEIDLDGLNVSILMISGIGFGVFTKILSSLEIDWMMRTDNDIFKIPKQETYQFAGIRRVISSYDNSPLSTDAITEIVDAVQEQFYNLPSPEPSAEVLAAAGELMTQLNPLGFFLSEVDLETDMFESPIKEDLIAFYDGIAEADIINEMKKSKAISMFDFLKSHKESLGKLADHPLAHPLVSCRDRIQNLRNGVH
ncbi:MAG: ATP-dependent nuclease [Pyrinomonadaceae bacterium]